MAKQTFSVGQVLTAAQMTSLQQTAMLGGAASAKTASYTLVAADAGTAISMTSTSATTITVNTGLFAAGDTVQITNLGSGVCTITAGTATVNTSASLALAQYESGTLDFTSASAAIFIKGAGASAAPASGLTFISTNSFSASNQVNVDNVFTSTYQQYKIFINITARSADTNIQFRLRAGGTTNSGNDYTYIGWDVNDAGGSGAAYGVATSRLIQFVSNTGAATGSVIEIFNPQQTLVTKAFLQHDTGTLWRTMGGHTSVTTSYDGFSLVADVGENITGNYWVLGYQKS